MGGRLMAKPVEPLKEALQTSGAEAGTDLIIGLCIDCEKGYVRGAGTAVKLK